MSSEKRKKVKNKYSDRPNLFYRALARIGKFLMKIVWLPRTVYFAEKFPKEGSVMCICNHYSPLDACVIYHKLFNFQGRIAVKAEAMNNRFVGNFLTALCRAISVSRGDSDIGALREMLKELNSGGKVLIFPEGTRSKDGKSKTLLPFKEGAVAIALRTKTQLVPTLYYCRQKPFGFKGNKLIVGDPIDLSRFYDKPIRDVKDEANAYVVAKMNELRVQIDEIVEKYHGKLDLYLAAHAEDKALPSPEVQSDTPNADAGDKVDK